MAVSMGLVKNEHGVWVVRVKVPPRLQEAVARVFDNGKARQTWLQKTTGTKNKAEAKRIAIDILAEFNKTLAEAKTLLAERPLRTALSQAEIDRIAEFHYASTLAADEDFTTDGHQADEDLVHSVADQLTAAGVEYDMPASLDGQRPPYGLTNRQVTKREAELAWYLPIIRAALARGDISTVSEAMAELLDRSHLNLDPNGAAYRQLGLAVLRADVRAHEALARRYRGEPIETPSIAHLELSNGLAPTGDTLRTAFAGWQKERERSPGTLAEYERAIGQFIQLHGNLPLAKITRDHARRFREALQDVPPIRRKELAKMTLPELVEWRRAHPDAPRIKNKSVNKQFGGVQAIVNWARENGMIPDNGWHDPFTKMQLDEDDPQGGPFTPDELRTLFASSVFTADERPPAGKGDVAFWLPLLALLTGARRGELAMLRVSDIEKDEATGHWAILIRADKPAGKSLKTPTSARTIPVHPELMRLGFLDFVATARKSGTDTWLFAAVIGERIDAWSQWFGDYLANLKIGGRRKGLHSLRHNFKDALRAGAVDEGLNDALLGQNAMAGVGRSYGARGYHAAQSHKIIVDRFTMSRLVAAIGTVTYPTIDLQAVRWRTTDNNSKEQC
jgi:integrase